MPNGEPGTGGVPGDNSTPSLPVTSRTSPTDQQKKRGWRVSGWSRSLLRFSFGADLLGAIVLMDGFGRVNYDLISYGELVVNVARAAAALVLA